MKLLSFHSLGFLVALGLANGASAQTLNLSGNNQPQTMEFYCINDTGVLEQPLCVPAEQAQATPSVRGSHSLRQQKQVATKADIIILSSKVAKLEAKLARIPNTFNNRRKTEKLKDQILAMHYELTMLTANLSN
ncbi:hypothetical protein N9O95_02370 [Alphaproteobacteria bacterium]|nr:hypothetical protein [Alphaproteobacteria bacterium]